MPGAESEHPRPACVEDWDEDAQTTLSSTRATANVAVKRSTTSLFVDPIRARRSHDGSDSGYSSKAGTVASASTGGKKMPSLSLDTSLPERERHPYSMTPQPRPAARRGFSEKASAAEYAPSTTREKPFAHNPGVCMTCDYYGRHIDAKDLPRNAPPPTPKSPKATKKSSKADCDAEAKLRRKSSSRESRPAYIYPPSATQAIYATNPVYASSGYTTPITPQMPYSPGPVLFSYATPITSTFVGYQAQADYFAPAPSRDDRPSKPSRRSSIYGDPIIQQPRKEEARTLEKVPSRDARPTVKSHKSNRSIDQERADRAAMPPPTERPSQKAQLARRPSMKKSATYNTAIVDHRRSRGPDDYERRENKASARQPSPIREQMPPSSYKPILISDPAPARPQSQRKSVSYSDPITTTKVAATKPVESLHQPRRNTAPAKPTLEQKEAEAEAYIQRKSQLTSEELTAEKISEMKSTHQTVSSRSETGSAFSYKSHQSSSKDSSGRGPSHTLGQRTSILIDGGVKLDIPKDYMDRTGRPLSINLDGLSISVGNKDKSASSSTQRREQKLIEKAPSTSSHASKRSVTDSSHTSSKGKERDRDDRAKISRRSSHISESRPPVSGHGNSQKSSRAPSSTRASVDYDAKRSRRQSVDYDQTRFIYGA